MPENRIDSFSAGDGIQDNFSVDAVSTDGPTGEKEFTWMNTQDKVTFEDITNRSKGKRGAFAYQI